MPEAIALVCEHLGKADKANDVIEKIREIYDGEKETIKFLAQKQRIHRALGEEFGKTQKPEDFVSFKEGIASSVSIPDRDDDLLQILKIYPHKGLAKRIQSMINLSRDGYRELALSLVTSGRREEATVILKKYLPEIPTN